MILGVARGVGETAPVLLTSGVTGSMNVNPHGKPDDVTAPRDLRVRPLPQDEMIARGFATAAVLMLLVLGLFVLARVLGGRPAGQLSKRQARRMRRDPARDLTRFESRTAEVAA